MYELTLYDNVFNAINCTVLHLEYLKRVIYYIVFVNLFTIEQATNSFKVRTNIMNQLKKLTSQRLCVFTQVGTSRIMLV